MHLYNLTLQKGTAVTQAVAGSFSAAKAQEIVVSHGTSIELMRPDETGKVQTVHSTSVFGVVRSLDAFRLLGGHKDYLAVGSDSGRLLILFFDATSSCFQKVHEETFGKSGCRRNVPGQFVTAEPKGRAVLIGAIEKAKLVYVINRDTEVNLTISSPLEAHKSTTLCWHVVALECGYNDPHFAAIELDYTDADEYPDDGSEPPAASSLQKMLTYYRLDFGLHNMFRQTTTPLETNANLLVRVPGGDDGPGGVIVCSEDFISYFNENHPEVRAFIPRRKDLPDERGVLITCTSMYKTKSTFFFLLQSEYGDLYKVTLDSQKGRVNDVIVSYFDTIPPAVSICMMRSGLLFAASAFGNQQLFQFCGLGENEAIEARASDAGHTAMRFTPRKLVNLELIDSVESLSPIVDMQVSNMMKEETPQLFAVCGASTRSTLKVLRQGMALSELAVSELPGTPSAVWTVKLSHSHKYDSYIVLSFKDSTLVLAVGETVEEVSDSGFLGNVPTLHVSLLRDDSLVQVHESGIRHIKQDKRANEWKTPSRKRIFKVTANVTQVVVALDGGEIVYFELESGGQLLETDKKDMAGDVASVALGEVPAQRIRSNFLAIGMYDSTVRVLRLEPEHYLESLAVQALADTPESLLITDMPTGIQGELTTTFLNIGLNNGVLLRTVIDSATGQLSDTRTRFLGARAPKLFATRMLEQRAMLALSTRPWLGFAEHGRYTMSPISYEPLEYAAAFASEQCPEGFVAISKNTLRVLSIDRLGESFNKTSTQLRYTPRSLSVIDDIGCVAVAEAENGVLPYAQRKYVDDSGMDVDTDGLTENGNKQKGEDNEDDEEDELKMEPFEQFGAPRSRSGQWASCVQLYSASNNAIQSTHEMENNEAAITCCLVEFISAKTEQTMLVVGTAKDLTMNPQSHCGGMLRVYRPVSDGTLEFVHATPIEGIPAALHPFHGRVLVGIGTTLRLYDLGKKRMLRKAENRQFPTMIRSIDSAGDRIYVADARDSFFFAKYRKEDNQLYIFADDQQPRYITATAHIDYDTMACGDKFGNISIVRLPKEVSDEVEDDPTAGRGVETATSMNGAPNKASAEVNFYVGETVTSLGKVQMQPGGNEVLLYSTNMGTVGALLPFTSRDDLDFCAHLEMHMRQEKPPLCGRDHLSFRSHYFPVRNCIDGDLCEQFAMLDAEVQRSVAEQLERTSAGDVHRKLEEIRGKVV